MNSDIEQFLKYASPRLEYLYGNSMVKEAVIGEILSIGGRLAGRGVANATSAAAKDIAATAMRDAASGAVKNVTGVVPKLNIRGVAGDMVSIPANGNVTADAFNTLMRGGARDVAGGAAKNIDLSGVIEDVVASNAARRAQADLMLPAVSRYGGQRFAEAQLNEAVRRVAQNGSGEAIQGVMRNPMRRVRPTGPANPRMHAPGNGIRIPTNGKLTMEELRALMREQQEFATQSINEAMGVMHPGSRRALGEIVDLSPDAVRVIPRGNGELLSAANRTLQRGTEPLLLPAPRAAETTMKNLAANNVTREAANIARETPNKNLYEWAVNQGNPMGPTVGSEAAARMGEMAQKQVEKAISSAPTQQIAKQTEQALKKLPEGQVQAQTAEAITAARSVNPELAEQATKAIAEAPSAAAAKEIAQEVIQGSLGKDMMLRTGRSMASWITDPIAKFLRWGGRMTGAKGHFDTKTGKWIFDGLGKEGFGNTLASWGENFDRAVGTKAFNRAIYRNGGALVRNGKLTAEEFRTLDKSKLRNFGAGALGTAGVIGASQIPVVGDVVDAPFKYLTPWGLGLTGLEYGINKYQQAKQDAIQQGFDAATLSALATQRQMSDAIRNGGRWQHFMGLIDPDGYANTVDERSIPVLASTFAERARQMQVNNNFEQILKMLQYANMNNNTRLS